jgi:hypothetical protein
MVRNEKVAGTHHLYMQNARNFFEAWNRRTFLGSERTFRDIRACETSGFTQVSQGHPNYPARIRVRRPLRLYVERTSAPHFPFNSDNNCVFFSFRRNVVGTTYICS